MSTRNWNVGELMAGYTNSDLDSLTKEDFSSMAEMLKYATSNMAAMEQKMVALQDEVKTLKFENNEFVRMNLDFKKILKKDDKDSRKLRGFVRRYQHDNKSKFIIFYLNGIKAQLTREQFRQIVQWYKPGEVYFCPPNSEESQDENNVNHHIYHFGEIVSYVDHLDETREVDVIVTYEDDTVVSIVTLDMIIQQRHITPMHVLKYLVKRKASPPCVIINQDQIRDFLIYINYTGGFDDTLF